MYIWREQLIILPEKTVYLEVEINIKKKRQRS